MSNDQSQLAFCFDNCAKSSCDETVAILDNIWFPENEEPEPEPLTTTSEKDFFKMFDQLAVQSHLPVHKVFEDFCVMGSCIVHNFGMQEPLLSSYMPQYEKRHKEYHQYADKYQPEQIRLVLEMVKTLAELMAYQPDDYLGRYFGQMGLDKHFHGQFFTPIHICEMMAKITLSSNFDAEIKERGYMALGEPACGSGAMIIGAVRALKSYGAENLGGKLLIMATDIDRLCVNMAYLQLGILGMSAHIVHGNTLTMETWDTFDTPNLQINYCLGHFHK